MNCVEGLGGEALLEPLGMGFEVLKVYGRPSLSLSLSLSLQPVGLDAIDPLLQSHACLLPSETINKLQLNAYFDKSCLARGVSAQQ